MEWGFVLGLVGITLIAISLVIYFGLKLNRAVLKHSSDSDLPLYITPTGNVVFAMMVSFWIFCAAARVWNPESSIGAFLNQVDGLVSVLVASVFFAATIGAVLEKFGYPIASRDRPRPKRDDLE